LRKKSRPLGRLFYC